MKAATSFIPWFIMVTFIIIMMGAMFKEYPNRESFTCGTGFAKPEPVGNWLVDAFATAGYFGGVISSLLTGCGPWWVLVVIFLPIAMAIILYLVPFK